MTITDITRGAESPASPHRPPIAVGIPTGWPPLGIVTGPSPADRDDATTVFLQLRPRLLRLARRTLGDDSEAEDIVQEAWLRWQRTDRTAVTNPSAFLATTTTRLALNARLSARRRHESRYDPQTVDPADPGATPEDGAETREAAERAVLLMLQTLSPLERAVYLLRQAFGYPHARIAAVLGISPAHARQVLLRGRRGLATRRRRPVDAVPYRRLLLLFLDASRSGDLAALERYLACDAGGVTAAPPAPAA